MQAVSESFKSRLAHAVMGMRGHKPATVRIGLRAATSLVSRIERAFDVAMSAGFGAGAEKVKPVKNGAIMAKK